MEISLFCHKGPINAGVTSFIKIRSDAYSLYISLCVAPSGFFMAFDAMLPGVG
jgi:hypothetical protein